MFVFGGLAHLAERKMVTVLLSAFRVAAGRLEMAVGERADPHLLPGGRYGERADAFDGPAIA